MKVLISLFSLGTCSFGLTHLPLVRGFGLNFFLPSLLGYIGLSFWLLLLLLKKLDFSQWVAYLLFYLAFILSLCSLSLSSYY